jgi:sporulation protein YlmC with PRC-barrel domain
MAPSLSDAIGNYDRQTTVAVSSRAYIVMRAPGSTVAIARNYDGYARVTLYCPRRRKDTMTTSSGHTSAIRATKVLGTKVQNPAGQKIGEIKDVILDKQSNHIMFAVLSFGGFLGMAEKYHPVPWASLDYDEDDNAYVVNYSKEQLQAAPAGSVEELTRDDGLNFRDRTYEYYHADRYWE